MCIAVQCATVQELILSNTPFHSTHRCGSIKVLAVKVIVIYSEELSSLTLYIIVI